MKRIRQAIANNYLLLDVDVANIADVIEQALHHLVHRGDLPAEQQSPLAGRLVAREAASSTAIGNSIAIPHIYDDDIASSHVVIVRLKHPLNLGAPDGFPTQFFFVLLGPKGEAGEHIKTLMQIARLMSVEEFRYNAIAARSVPEFLAAFDHVAPRLAPPKEEVKVKVSDGMQYTGRLGGGLWRDLKRRARWYASDIVDGLHTKSISSTLFLLFACLAPAVTFGGFMAIGTNGQIGAVEMIAASVICGIAFALFSGQPLIILGGTGPLLVFTVLLFQLCQEYNLPFLPTYAWIGLWTMVILFVLAVTDASALMRYFTRFTDETFAALISIIFIYEAGKAVFETFHEVYNDPSVSHDKALLSLLLALGTFWIAFNLSAFRRSRYLYPRFREFLADFGPTIALALMTLVAVMLSGVTLDRLEVPAAFSIDTINLFEAPKWVWFAAAIPAMLVSVLVYLDQNITARIINNPQHHLEKGEAYHWDLAVVGGLIGLCSMFGLPWLVAATVRSLNHLRSLATVEESVSAGGEKKERILHVRETRLTGFGIHVLMGVSLLPFILPILQMIPMPVLWGLFLYMGVVSMRGNQFFERLNLWPMDPALYPATHYIRRVPLPVIHVFTFIQLFCLVVLWVVKQAAISAVAILFPLFIALLVPFRMLMSRFFPERYLEALDAEEEPEEEATQWH